jgi:hypothetical protein
MLVIIRFFLYVVKHVGSSTSSSSSRSSSSSSAFRSQVSLGDPIGLCLATPYLFWHFLFFMALQIRSFHSTLFYLPVKMLHQLKCCTSSSSRFLVFLLIILFSVFFIFHCHLSVLTSNLFHKIWAVHFMTKIFQFAYCYQYNKYQLLYQNWWWTVNLSVTCRVVYQNKVEK